MKKPLFNVLLSTYNGGKFLKPQIDSVLNQQNVRIILTIRDDGSSDPVTREVLSGYASDLRVKIDWGDNLGVLRSFYQLLKNSEQADFYAFCDQDDVWFEDKLARAAARLVEHPPGPLLYCSRKIYTDSKLNPIGTSSICSRPVTVSNAVVENIATGCTSVFNPQLLDLALKITSLNGIYMHDWWLCLLASAFGSIIFDEKPSIYYRQHSHNQVGATPNYFIRLAQRIKRVRKTKSKNDISWLNQARAFKKQYSDLLTPEQKHFFDLLDNYDSGIIDRYKIITGPEALFMQSTTDTFFLRLLILFRLFWQ